MEIFDKYYDEHEFAKNSQYNNFTKKHLVIEAEYLETTLLNLLDYLDGGGSDLDFIRAEVMDGLYESRI